MPLSVWTYEIPTTDEFTLDLPYGAQILTVQDQQALGVMLWALVDPQRLPRPRFFRLARTGYPIDAEPSKLRFINTFQLEGVAFHLFEVVTDY